MANEYDVIIVGGGPAGSICAHILGQSQVKVLLIEKGQFPRDKTCGDFISARLSDHMKRLGVCNAVKMTPHAMSDDLLFSHPAVGSFLIKDSLKRICSTGFVCKREHLDQALFEKAKKSVDILEGTKVKGLLFDNDKVVGVATESQKFYAKIVVGADGANGVIAKALGVETLDENHNAVAIRSYYSNVKGLTNSVELHFIDEVQPGYFWIFPTGPGEANVGLGVLSRNVRYRNLQLKQLLEKIIKEHPQFCERFTHSIRLAPIKGWSLPFGSKKRPISFNGALLIGDAAGLIDPMSGEGIENAFRSAECAAKTIQQALAANDFSLSSLKNYEKDLESLLRPELRRGYIIQKISRNPTCLKLIFFLLKHFPFTRKLIANKFF